MNRHDPYAWLALIAITGSIATIIGFVVLICTGHITFERI